MQITYVILDHLKFEDNVDTGDRLAVRYLETLASILSYICGCLFWSVNCAGTVWKLHIFLDHFGFIDSVDIGDYLAVGHLERSVSTLSHKRSCFSDL